jgi:hypothetical protein
MDMINGLSSADKELVMCLTREWIGQKHAKNDDACVCIRMILHQASSQSCTAQSIGMQQISFDYGRKYVLACVFFFVHECSL